MRDTSGRHAGAAPVLRGQDVPACGTAVQVQVPRRDEDDQPVVRVNKQDQVVHSIDVVCACGCVTRIICEYGDQPTIAVTKGPQQ